MKLRTVSAVSYVSQLSEPSNHVGDYAHRAIKTYVSHICRQEKGVLAHRDPEFLHQMRVGLRRLRTVCKAFDFAIALPDAINDRALKRLGKTLGSARDLDVLQRWLHNYANQTPLDKAETKVLKKLNRRLKKQRRHYLTQIDKLLHSQTYKQLFKTLKQWLKQPQYKSASKLSLAVALPDIQLPMMGQLLLHPGWLVSDDKNNQELKQVHALRKQIKGIRYQMALFREFYGETYKNQVTTFKQMQDVLGELQDEVVLQSFLVKTLGRKWTKKLPSLNQDLKHQHQQLWRQWITLRQPYLSLEPRDALYRLCLISS